ncbi:MAG: sugar ABC transporter permease [Chloroflexi bacterium]|nr:sugar ABC transporter permease [Chloroflexota bacterium]
MTQQVRVLEVPPAEPVRSARIRRWRFRRYIFILPTAAYLFIGTIYLMLYALAVSFTAYDLQFNPTWEFVGLRNYHEIFADEQFWRSLRQTAWIAIPALVLEFLAGFGMALMLNRNFRGRALAISLIATPVMVSLAATGMSFRMLLSPKYGPINDILSMLSGQDVLIDWLGSISLARPAIVLVDVWHSSPFFMLLLLAALQNIPDEVYEAARVDGANTWQIFVRVTIPLLKPVMVLGLLLRAIDLTRIFDVIFVMTQGGPGTQTQTISYYVYTEGLGHFRIGYAAAIAWVLCIGTIIFSQVFLRVTRQTGQEETA